MQNNISSATGILHLWFSKVSGSTLAAENGVTQMLSASEHDRLNAIGSKARRREYLLSRAMMRHALSQCFPAREQEWLVADRPRSAPLVSNLPAGRHISLSHSHGCICFAISACPLGIDIEAADQERDYAALAEVFMNDEEMACLAASKSAQADYFYRVWSAKEAYYKMLSRAEQAVVSLNRIRYSVLRAKNTCGYLYEGRLGDFVVAAMMPARPERVSRNYFLVAEEHLEKSDNPQPPGAG